MPYRGLIIAGRTIGATFVVALVAYLVVVGLEKADKVASSIAAVLALISLIAPPLLLLSGPTSGSESRPDGRAHATGAGSVAVGGDNSGRISSEVEDGAPLGVLPSAEPGAHATGPGAVAIGGNNRARIRTRFTRGGGSLKR